ncbi:MAG: TetR/AcrR family transcriptional regulator [Kineosporiaceae bacterium]
MGLVIEASARSFSTFVEVLFSRRGIVKRRVGGVTGGRGRRPTGADTREAIMAAARRQFAEVGYRRASMRAIAAEAGVDPRLILHFFGSKQELFVAVVEFPFEPAEVFDRLLATPPDARGPGVPSMGRRFAEFVLSILEDPRARGTMTGLLRAAASEEEAAAMVRDLIATRMLLPFAKRVGRDRPEFRAALVASSIVGIVMARHVVAVPPMAEASAAEIVDAIAPVLDHYLTGDLAADVM